MSYHQLIREEWLRKFVDVAEATLDDWAELETETFELEHCAWSADPQKYTPSYVDYLLGRHSGRFCH